MVVLGESQIYRELMRFRPDDLSPNAWAVKAGVSRTVWADMRRHGNPSRRTLEKLLDAAGSSLLEFEALRFGRQPPRLAHAAGGALGDASSAWGPGSLPPLPLVGSRQGPEWPRTGSEIWVTEIRRDELVEQLPRPPSLAADPDAFALTISTTTMWPRFRIGTRVAVSPRAKVTAGEEVAVRLQDADSGGWLERWLIMHLVGRNGSGVELRQFNPELTVRVEGEAIEAVLKIVGELI